MQKSSNIYNISITYFNKSYLYMHPPCSPEHSKNILFSDDLPFSPLFPRQAKCLQIVLSENFLNVSFVLLLSTLIHLALLILFIIYSFPNCFIHLIFFEVIDRYLSNCIRTQCGDVAFVQNGVRYKLGTEIWKGHN